MPFGYITLSLVDNATQSKIGFVNYRNFNGHIENISVIEEYRRQGVAKYMLDHVEYELVARNVSSIWADAPKEHFFWSKLKGYVWNEKNRYIKYLD